LGGLCSGKDGCVPVGDLKPVFDREGGLEHGDGVFLNAETKPLGNEARSKVVGKRIATAGMGGLDVKFLKHLH